MLHRIEEANCCGLIEFDVEGISEIIHQQLFWKGKLLFGNI